MKDFLGHELHVGDEVVYRSCSGRYASVLSHGEVVGFTPKMARINEHNNLVSGCDIYRIGSGKTGKEMLAELGYEPLGDGARSVLFAMRNGDDDLVMYFDGSVCVYECPGAPRPIYADEIHALHYLLKGKGM